MFRIFLFACLVVFMVVPLSYPATQAQTQQPGIQGNQQQTPYYDPRYTPNRSQQNQRSAPQVNKDESQILELPKTAGEEAFLAFIGILSLIGAAGLRLASYSSRG